MRSQLFFFILSIFLPASLLASVSEGGGTLVNLPVMGCNNNGICEPSSGENTLNCALDCPSVPAPTVTLLANPETINLGDTSVLSWSSTNADSCSASWTSSMATSSVQSVAPLVTTTFSISCTGAGGTATGTVTVTVVSSQTPTVNISANPDIIDKGGSSILSWTSNNTTSCGASWTNSTATSSVQSVSPFITTTYSITCSGPGGTASDATTLVVRNKTTAGSLKPEELKITDLSVSVGKNNATIIWSANSTVLSVFSWGLSPDQELGSVSDIFFIKDHRVNLSNLIPDTHYYFKIYARDLRQREILYLGDFMTLPKEVSVPNVTNLVITYPSQKIALTWHNPSFKDFAGTLVLRSPYKYPEDRRDGKVIYDGRLNYAIDETVEKDKTYYYTVFAYDTNGNYSSGTSVSGKIETGNVVSTTVPPFGASKTVSKPAPSVRGTQNVNVYYVLVILVMAITLISILVLIIAVTKKRRNNDKNII